MTEKKSYFHVKEEKMTIGVPHRGKELRFALPDEHPERLDCLGLLKPTFGEIVSLACAVIQNSKDNPIAARMRNHFWLSGFSAYALIKENEDGSFSLSDRNRKNLRIPGDCRMRGGHISRLDQNALICALAEDRDGLENLARLAVLLRRGSYVSDLGQEYRGENDGEGTMLALWPGGRVGSSMIITNLRGGGLYGVMGRRENGRY